MTAAASAHPLRGTRDAASPTTAASAACSQPYYNLESTDKLRWNTTMTWSYNVGHQPSYVRNDAIGAIRSGIRNLTENHNDCGAGPRRFAVAKAYAGATKRPANLDRNGACTSAFPDGHNVVDWGPLPAGVLAVTCYATTDSGFVEADIRIASNNHVVATLPDNCSGSEDLQSIMTHEWGHAFGLAHESSGPDETMYPSLPGCSTYARTLGQGDTLGMNALYGAG